MPSTYATGNVGETKSAGAENCPIVESCLLDHATVPATFRQPYILTGYRSPGITVRRCLYSLFQPSNETLNVWTHLLPATYFLGQLLSNLYTGVDVQYSLPMLIFLAASSLCLYISAFAHTFNALSVTGQHVCFFFDYLALSLYAHSSAVAYYAYMLPTSWLASENAYIAVFYMAGSALTSILGFCISSMTRFMGHEESGKKRLRCLGFGLPYLFVSTPVLLRLFCPTGRLACLQMPSRLYWIRHYQWIFVCSFAYVSHLPERLWPGRFDFLLHSHQLFHVFGALGIQHQMVGISLEMNQHSEQLMTHFGHWPIWTGSIAWTLVVLLINLGLLVCFAKRLRLYKRVQ